MEKMETLQALAVAALMSLVKDVHTWEEVEDELLKMEGGWKLWVMEEEIKRVWAKHQMKKKKTLFKEVHRQLVSIVVVVEIPWCRPIRCYL